MPATTRADHRPRVAAERRERMRSRLLEISGTGLMAIHRIASGRTPKDYPEKVTAVLLRSLGVRAAAAARLTVLPLPKLTAPPDSLLARAQARASATKPEPEPEPA